MMTQPIPWIRHYGPILLVCLLVLGMTTAEYLGDTPLYTSDVLSHLSGKLSANPFGTHLWDFGHLFWRPVALVLFQAFGDLTPYSRSQEPALVIAWLLIVLNLAATVVHSLLVHNMAYRIIGHNGYATLLAAAFLTFNATLNFAHSGSAYVFGLSFSMLAAWLVFDAVESGQLTWTRAALAGASLALATLIWFPYLFGSPGLAALALFWKRSPNPKPLTPALRFTIGVALSSGVFILLGYAFALLQLPVHSAADVRDWVLNSSHQMTQSNRVIRMVNGLVRSFLVLGNESVLIKRYLFRDPYASVTPFDIFRVHLWKLLFFYGLFAFLGWYLLRSALGRRALAILASGAAVVFFFALVIFESGAAERYMPFYPFLALALASFYAVTRSQRLTTTVATAGLLLISAHNIYCLSHAHIDRTFQSAANRAALLAGKVSPGGFVALLSHHDDMYRFAALFPFHPQNRRHPVPIWDIIEPGTSRAVTWRADFARRTLDTLEKADTVWVSKRMLAETPDPAWLWVEGDDRRLHWKDWPPFFRQLSYDQDIGGADGFVRLQNTDDNRSRLRQLAAQQPPPATPHTGAAH